MAPARRRGRAGLKIRVSAVQFRPWPLLVDSLVDSSPIRREHQALRLLSGAAASFIDGSMSNLILAYTSPDRG